MHNPRVSVCISTYDRCDFLRRAVQSVLDQTFSDWELIICDDGSTDGTFEFINSVKEERLRYIRHSNNIGKSNNMRSGFEVARGLYFIKFDDDDCLTCDFLTQTVAILDRFSDIDFVGTDHWIIGADGQRDLATTEACSKLWGRKELGEGRIQNLLEVVFNRQSFYIGATLFRYSSLRSIDYMRPNLNNCEDVDLFLRLALAGNNGYYLPLRLMEYCFHEGQSGSQRSIPFLKDKLSYLESYKFKEKNLETSRRLRILDTKVRLATDLIKVGEIAQGRLLLGNSNFAFYFKPKVYLKSLMMLFISYMPANLRHLLFRFIYAEDMK